MSQPSRIMLSIVNVHVNSRCRHAIRFLCTRMMRALNESSDCNDSNSTSPYVLRLQVIGNGALGISKSVLLRYLNSRVLFNCGESSDTYFKGNVNDVYVTHINWENIGGLLSLTYKALTSKRDQIFICGPSGLDYFMGAAERFLRVYKNHNFTIHFSNQYSNFENLRNNFKTICIPIKGKRKKKFSPSQIDKSWLKSSFVFKNLSTSLLSRAPTGNFQFDTSYSYICKTESGRGWLLSECARKGIKPGAQMQQLWKGENVTLDDGTVVQPNDVIEVKTCPSIIIVDCPTEGYLNDLLRKKEYEMYYKSENSLDSVIIHFTPIDVMHDTRYIAWMRRFPLSTKHLIVNDSNDWSASAKSRNRQEVCRLISPQFFPSLRKPRETMMTMRLILQDDGIKYGVDVEPAWFQEEPTENWLQKWSGELKEFQLIQSRCGTCIDLTSLKTERYVEPFAISSVPSSIAANSKCSPRYSARNPRITFLGTCSEGNSLYRNTSGILLQMSENMAMLLDCGDGTVKQLATLFDDDELLKVLTSLKCIFISHSHADHHVGVIGLLVSIKRAWNLLGKQPKKVLLFVPPPLIDWFEKFHYNIEPILDGVTLINMSNLAKPMVEQIPITSLLREMCGLRRVKICWAIHCAHAYCITLEHASGWKISYSGDTEYNESFAKMGLYSDLLIHEATYGTGLNLKARVSKHSTTAHAIKIGEEMQAKNVILTHFSRRYSIIPCLKDLENTSNVSVAFDFLQFTLDDAHLLPKLNDAYTEVFKEYEMNNIELNMRHAREIDVSSSDE